MRPKHGESKTLPAPHTPLRARVRSRANLVVMSIARASRTTSDQPPQRATSRAAGLGFQKRIPEPCPPKTTYQNQVAKLYTKILPPRRALRARPPPHFSKANPYHFFKLSLSLWQGETLPKSRRDYLILSYSMDGNSLPKHTISNKLGVIFTNSHMSSFLLVYETRRNQNRCHYFTMPFSQR